MAKRFLSGINVTGISKFISLEDASENTGKFLVLASDGTMQYRTSAETLSDIGGVPNTRQLTINGITYDLTANRSWTLTTSNIAEGSNLYYTDARVGSYLTANSYATQSYVATQIANLVASSPAALDTLNELAAALGNDANFATTTATSLGNRLRIDIGTQGLTSTQQGYGRTNLGLGSLATLSSIGNGYITDVAWSKVTGAPAFITGYTETDTLASVTGRGATTTTAIDVQNRIYSRASQSDNNYTTAALWTQSFSSTTTGIAFHISGNVGKFLEMRTNGILYWDNGQVWTSSNLTNLNQLSNGPGYLTSIIAHNQAWSTITGTPTTLAGYGISNGLYSVGSDFTTAGAGWYRVATTSSDGRGYYYIEVYCTGGNHNPAYLRIEAMGDWGSDKLIAAYTDLGFPANNVRITRGASNTFLEVYFTTTILGASMRVTRLGFDSGVNLYSGSLPGGGDTVKESLAVVSKINAASLNITGNSYYGGTANFNYIQNGSVWINNGADYNSYNENIRLFNAPNGVSVIAFSASGTGGTPTTSILGYSDRLEFRYGNDARIRMYSSYIWTPGAIYTDNHLYTNYSIRVGEIWGMGGLYRSSGIMGFGTENEGWRFSMANVQKCYIGTDGNIWMAWAGDYLSNLLGAKQNASTAINTGNIGSQSVNQSNYSTMDYLMSIRNFGSGTLVQTSINYAVTYGEPFVLEIKGNSYGNGIPWDIQIQGYIYADTIINIGGYSNGTNISGLRAINYGGNLCFWWPSQGYWHGFTVKVYVAYDGRQMNKVTSISDTGQPTSAKQVDFSPAQSLRTDNAPYAANMNQYVRSSDGVTFNAVTSSTRFSAPGMTIGYWDGANNRIEGSGRPLFITSYSNPITFGIDGGENIRISTYGQLLINAASSGYGSYGYGYNLGVRGNSSQAYMSIAINSQTLDTQGLIIGLDTNAFRFHGRDNKPIIFANNDTERVWINTSGALLINTSTHWNNEKLGIQIVNGNNWTNVPAMMRLTNYGSGYMTKMTFTDSSIIDGWLGMVPISGGSYFVMGFSGYTEQGFKVYQNGSVVAAGDVTAYSDIRVKENIITIDNALEKTLALRGVYYNRIDTEDKRKKIGVIAQEVQKVAPELVTRMEDDMLNVSYGNMAGLFIEAIKELKQENDELRDILKRNNII